MQRSDYSFHDLSEPQYEAIVTAAEMDGNTSPMHGHENYLSMINVSRQEDVDPRVALAATLFEDHDGTDPAGGVALASVYNFGGITFAGQPGAFKSGVLRPANEQSFDANGNPLESNWYAGFSDFGGFVAELYRTLNNSIIGQYFQSGDLVTAWAVYIGGPGNPNMAGGQARVDQFSYYLHTYPSEGGAPVSTSTAVYGEDVVSYLESLQGQGYATAATDPVNYPNYGAHAWAYWCRDGVERAFEHCGLTVVRHSSAIEAQYAASAQGLLHGPGDPLYNYPEHGAVMQFDTTFYSPDGHTNVWNRTRGQSIGTLTDGTGFGYRNWGPGTPGYAGWYRMPGIVGEFRSSAVTVPPAPVSHPVMEQNWVPTPNPYDKNPGVKGVELGLGGGFLSKFRAVPDPFTVYGWPMTNEMRVKVVDGDGSVRYCVGQFFERATMLYHPDDAPPWDVVDALENEKVTPA